MEQDLEDAGMDKEIPEGKIGFHACRTVPYEQNKLVEAGGIEPIRTVRQSATLA